MNSCNAAGNKLETALFDIDFMFTTYMYNRPFSCDVTGLARAIYKAVWCTAATYKYIECARVEALLFQFGH